MVANGLVEGINTLLSALMTFLLQFMQFDWQHHGQWIFLLSSLIVAAMLAVIVQLKNILVDFAFYLLISSFYHVLLAVASNLIASQLPSGSYSLIFGFNTFLALIFGYRDTVPSLQWLFCCNFFSVFGADDRFQIVQTEIVFSLFLLISSACAKN
uniref:Uncharacterized protein n=1 Tax=Ditylenchus dipsaci TaxID=166011 RepID=A0A915ENE6_9BILA